MFLLSYNKALRIQRAQLVWYRHRLGWRGTRFIRQDTKPCPADIHPDTPVNVGIINKLVPRGGDIEYACALRRGRIGKQDPTADAWHEAIKRGLV